MSSAFEDVLAWAETRPWWQQKALARIARGEALGDTDVSAIAQSLLEDSEPTPDGGWFVDVASAPTTKDEPVRIRTIKGLMNVNQLASEQELTFAPDGLTVVFGNNGSGKSGYARVIRSMVRTRHQTDILPNVFAQAAGPQAGEVVFSIGSSEHTGELGSPKHPELGRVAFYDEHCGDTYVRAEADFSYRPAALQLLDDLASACTSVRRTIEGWQKDIEQPGELPEVDALANAGQFLSSLHATTTDDAIAAATACAADIEKTLGQQVTEVARLRTSDPAQEKRRLLRSADSLDRIVQHLSELDEQLGAAAQQHLVELRQVEKTKRQASELASRRTFDADPLNEIGKPVWQSLWSAAEQYSQEVYPEHNFPHTANDAVCVLCQQPLEAVAADRMKRFRDFVADTTAREAANATRELVLARQKIERVDITPSPVLIAVAVIEEMSDGFTSRLDPIFELLRTRQAAMTTGGESTPVDTSGTGLHVWAQDQRRRAESVNAEGFTKQLEEAQAEEHRLRDQIAMRDGVALITAERDRLKKLAALETVHPQTNTRSITDKVGDLTRTHVTEEARDRFTRETDRLGLERVTFKATRASKGSLLHKADFLNARPGAKLVDVLSEGEQTALGFAGFVTEAHFDDSKSTLVFDDPVSSLDHMKREVVARRISALAEERQVIVFTHDIAFTMILRKAAAESDVQFTTRSVEQRRKVGPGFTSLDHPWTAQDAAQRIDTLTRDVGALRRAEEGMDETVYLQETEKIAGHMSQTWERIISQVLAEPLVDYKSLEVRVAKLRVVGRVTADDVKEYDDSYSRISGWASRHDPHPELNYTPPTVDQLNSEINVLSTWMKKVKKYQQP